MNTSARNRIRKRKDSERAELAMDKHRTWPCQHIEPVTDAVGYDWRFTTDEDFGDMVYVPSFWEFCPVCAAKRPTEIT